MDIPQMREGMNKFMQAGVASLSPLSASLEELVIQMPTRDGWQSTTKIVRPKADVDAERALVVLFFGGGFMVGGPDHLLNVARAFAETYGTVVALPSYRLFPEVQWPIPQHDGWDVVQWLSEHAENELGANLSAGFIVGGASAGATVATAVGGLAMFPDSTEAQAVSALAKPLTGQILCLPEVVTDESVPDQYKHLFRSWDENVEAPTLNTSKLRGILNNLNVTDFTSLWWTPLHELIKREPVHKFPIYMEHCNFDPMRDDVTIYQKVLESRGFATKTQLFPEDGHNSWTVVSSLMPAKAKNPTFEEAQMAGMKWILNEAT